MDLFSQIPFFKMEGIGNDYIYFDFTDREFQATHLNELEIPFICDRRYGIGADGIVVMTKSKITDLKMLMWNADGSQSKICGNALRCVSFYWYKKNQMKEFKVETGAGIHTAHILEDSAYSGIVRVSMNQPIFEAEKIPYMGDLKYNEIPLFKDEKLPYEGFVLSMGNPHCVFFVDDPDSIELEKIGPFIENHDLFPERVNVEFAKINPDGSIYQRTWERGTGETLACGSGACAVLVASTLAKDLPKKNTIHLKGGDLEIEWKDQIYMKGKASFVFKGYLSENYKLFI